MKMLFNSVAKQTKGPWALYHEPVPLYYYIICVLNVDQIQWSSHNGIKKIRYKNDLNKKSHNLKEKITKGDFVLNKQTNLRENKTFDPKSKVYFLSQYATYMWSLKMKVTGLKL